LPTQGSGAAEWLLRHRLPTVWPMSGSAKRRNLRLHRNQGESPMLTDWQELPRVPALPGLFARAGVRRGVRGRTLPARAESGAVTVDPDHLARFRALCGARDDGRLPPTYPHLLAFALQMKLLTERDFPFPLLGLVHLENRIRVLRPLGGLGPFRLSVATGQLAPHDKGVTFSLITR